MPRYPDPYRQPARKKKRAPAPKQSPARPQPKKQPVRAQSPKKPPVKKQPVKQPQKQQTQRRYSSLLFYLWIALAFPELVLHLSTAKSSEMLLNSGLLLGRLIFSTAPRGKPPPSVGSRS